VTSPSEVQQISRDIVGGIRPAAGTRSVRHRDTSAHVRKQPLDLGSEATRFSVTLIQTNSRPKARQRPRILCLMIVRSMWEWNEDRRTTNRSDLRDGSGASPRDHEVCFGDCPRNVVDERNDCSALYACPSVSGPHLAVGIASRLVQHLNPREAWGQACDGSRHSCIQDGRSTTSAHDKHTNGMAHHIGAGAESASKRDPVRTQRGTTEAAGDLVPRDIGAFGDRTQDTIGETDGRIRFKDREWHAEESCRKAHRSARVTPDA
jgi:hypothetical protein